MYKSNTRYPVKLIWAVFLNVILTEIARQKHFGGLFLIIHSIPMLLLLDFLPDSRQEDREFIIAVQVQQFVDHVLVVDAQCASTGID